MKVLKNNIKNQSRRIISLYEVKKIYNNNDDIDYYINKEIKELKKKIKKLINQSMTNYITIYSDKNNNKIEYDKKNKIYVDKNYNCYCLKDILQITAHRRIRNNNN